MVLSLTPSLQAPVYLESIRSYNQQRIEHTIRSPLQDASERGRLAASTFKNLNISFAAASFAILLNFATEFSRLNHSIGDVGLGWSFQVLVLALVFVVTSYNYLTARK